MEIRTDADRIRPIAWRIVPLLALVLLLSYLDKVNIGFAALQMNRALGLSNASFGFAAGIFALSYALAAVPSTIAFQRVGARRWIALMMLLWGCCSAATGFVSTTRELIAARLALGAAEAGFTPAVIFYLNSWFPAKFRGRILGIFLAILPISIVVGGPLSTLFLAWDGFLGLAGWQLLFVFEGLPTVLLGFVVWRFLPNGPEDAKWLETSDREWLASELTAGMKSAGTSWGDGIRPAPPSFVGRRFVLLLVCYLGITTAGTGALVFLPLLIRTMGFSVRSSSLLAAGPALIAAATLPLWGLWTDRSTSREWVVAATCISLGIGLVAARLLFPSPWALLPLTLAFVGFFGSVAPFWTLPSSFLAGSQAAAGIATLNVAGNLGAFFGPMLLGWLADRFGGYEPALIAVSGVALLAAIAVVASASVGRSRVTMVSA